jgi:large subunit ribosomal protein L24
MFLKKGMKVKVCIGRDKGKTGEIIEINRPRCLAKVKQVNMVKKHKKPTKENKGGIVSIEGSIHISNLKKLDQVKAAKAKK